MGTALAMACSHFGIDPTVYMVKVSYEKSRTQNRYPTFAQKSSQPVRYHRCWRGSHKEHPGTGGSLGCAISEAVETAMKTPNCRYVLGSVLNQVLLHQSVIGLEAKAALEKIDEYPDIIIGCTGGGSNFGGLISPFMMDTLTGRRSGTEFIAVEPASCPTLTRGRYAYDYCDTGHVTPLARMYTLGSDFIHRPTRRGLRYHGIGPVVSKLYHDGYIKAVASEQTKVFEALCSSPNTRQSFPHPNPPTLSGCD